jgi:acyl-CoA thioester hydrolase
VTSPVELRDHENRPIALDITDPYLHYITACDADIDTQGHVNNAVYVKWMDAAAWANSVAVGYDHATYQSLGSAFVVRRHEIDYLQPAYAGQELVVATWPCEMVRFNAMRRHQIIRLSDGVTLARALTHWVYLDSKTGRPRRMEPELIAAFRPRV